MKKILFTLLFLLSAFLLSAQNTDTVQPDSLYKKYKVHSRKSVYKGASTKSTETFVFDEDGRYSSFILTDNETGTLPQLTLNYKYNSKGILSAESEISFRKTGNLTRNAELFYDTNGELIKKVLKENGTVYSETIYIPSEKKETENIYRKDSIYTIQSTYYDNHNKKIRFTGKELADKNQQPQTFIVNGKAITFKPSAEDLQWDYIFENTYDSKGNLVLQKRLVDGKIADQVEYTYDKNGLLKEQKESNRQVVKFEYKYY